VSAWRHGDGQATVELLALVPLVMAAALAAATILAHFAAEEHAGEAAHAGAMALLVGEDAAAAARAALPAGSRDAARIERAGHRITVTLPPPAPLRAVLPRLTASATADAGPEPAP
jgi:hypothetical protein